MTEPVNKNFLSPLGYSFIVKKLPHVNFFTTRVNVPGVSMASVDVPTPFNRMPISGDKVSFDELTVTFKVDEDMENYIEVFNWIMGLGFPAKFDQYKSLASKGKFTGEGLYSDATVTIMTSAMNPNIEVTYKDLFPISLSEIEFSSTDADVEYLTATVTFRYREYTIAAV